MFNEAVDLAVEGEDEKSLEVFNKFIEAYPDSPLRQDALGAVRSLEQAALEPAEVEEATSTDTESMQEDATEEAAPAEEPAAESVEEPQGAQ